MLVELKGHIINLRNVTFISSENPGTPEKIMIGFVSGKHMYETLTIGELADFKNKVLAFNTK